LDVVAKPPTVNVESWLMLVPYAFETDKA